MKIKGIELKEFMGCMASVVFKYLPCFFYSRVFKKNLSPVWLISERKNDARDNGFALFKFIRKQHPEKPVFYVIDNQCQDYNKVKELGNVINWGSLMHYYFCANASLIASTDFGMGYPTPIMRPMLLRMRCCGKGKSVFLQHGITKDDLEHAKKHKLQVDMFVCGAKPEYDYILNNFGYTEKELKYIGFARFDTLSNTCSSNKILYMPTWRNNINTNSFSDTSFYREVSSFLSSNQLKTLLEENKTKMIFFLHPAFRDKIKYFLKFRSEYIEVANNEDYDLQDLLRSSSLLITDYSSIYFDFAYMNKPLIYYQFDYEEYRKNQYKEGYFRYEEDGFGPVVKFQTDLINQLTSIIKNGWRNPDLFSKRSKVFFILNDNNNCERHFSEFEKLIGEKC